MANTRWTTSHKAVFNIGYHIIWCPKYRRKVLVGDVATRLDVLLRAKAIELGCTVETLEIMPDHVHLFLKSSPIHAPHYLVQQLKGATSHTLREEFPALKTRLPTLWTRSYYCESIGHISEETVRRYIEEQKGQ
jgi:putative transposase